MASMTHIAKCRSKKRKYSYTWKLKKKKNKRHTSLEYEQANHKRGKKNGQ